MSIAFSDGRIDACSAVRFCLFNVSTSNHGREPPPTNALVSAIDVSALLQQQACALDGAVRCGMVQALVLGMGVRASFDNDVDACAFEGGGLRVRRS